MSDPLDVPSVVPVVPLVAVGSVGVPVEVPEVVVVGSVVVVEPSVVLPVVEPSVVLPAVEPSPDGAVDVVLVGSEVVGAGVVMGSLVLPAPVVEVLVEVPGSGEGVAAVPLVDVLGAVEGEASTVGSVCVWVRPDLAFFLAASEDLVVAAELDAVGALLGLATAPAFVALLALW